MGHLRLDKERHLAYWKGRSIPFGDTAIFQMFVLLVEASFEDEAVHFDDIARLALFVAEDEDSDPAKVRKLKERLVKHLKLNGAGDLAACIKSPRCHYAIALPQEQG